MKAFLKNYRQAPRKVRLIADHVRGKNAAEAMSVLDFMPNRGAKMMHKLIASAVANAKQTDGSLTANDFTIKIVTANKGITFVRYMPRAFGRAHPINRECSHVYVELASRVVKGGKAVTKVKPANEPVKEEKPNVKKRPVKKEKVTKKTK